MADDPFRGTEFLVLEFDPRNGGMSVLASVRSGACSTARTASATARTRPRMRPRPGKRAPSRGEDLLGRDPDHGVAQRQPARLGTGRGRGRARAGARGRRQAGRDGRARAHMPEGPPASTRAAPPSCVLVAHPMPVGKFRADGLACNSRRRLRAGLLYNYLTAVNEQHGERTRISANVPEHPRIYLFTHPQGTVLLANYEGRD